MLVSRFIGRSLGGAICRRNMATGGAGYEIGFVGLGAMGYPMAGQINKAFPTAVWNRTTSKAHMHSDEFGTTMINNLDELSCPVIFCCLPTSVEVEEMAEKLSGDQGIKLLVDCTSGDWKHTVKIGDILRQKNIEMVDCPVSGGVRGAEAGTLTAMYGGKPEDVELAMRYSMFAKVKHRLGPLGAGHATKAMNNILNTANFMLATEGLLALRNCGVSPEAALGVINKSSGRSLQSEVRIPEEVLDRRFGYGFKLNLMHKDVKTAEKLLNEQFPEAKVLPKVSETMDKVMEMYKDTPEIDYTHIATYLEKKAGVELMRDDLEREKREREAATPQINKNESKCHSA